MFLRQHVGIVNTTIPNMSTSGRNGRTPDEWLQAILSAAEQEYPV